MADSDQYNDEYQFADLDSIEPNEAGEGEPSAETRSEEPSKKNERTFLEPQNLKRNAAIAVGGLIFFIILYKWLSASPIPQKIVEPNIAPVKVVKPMESIVPASPPDEKTPPMMDNNVSQKISALELGEQNMRTDISTINEQLASMTNNLNAMNSKLAELSGIVTNLSNKLDQQIKVIEQKTVVQRQMKRTYYPSHHARAPYNKYYLQAVIPGRAWLMATSGVTLTVREGTNIPGYGMVKLIDPSQGRVLTSSGQIIKFNQNDS